MPPAVRGITQADWPSTFPAEVGPVVAAIVGGSPFARSLRPLPTGRTAVSFPLVNDLDDPVWGGELSDVPVLTADTDEYNIAVSRLSGSILISQESIDDAEWPLTQQTEQVIQDVFSSRLEADFISGDGTGRVPLGILNVAAEVTGADLALAAITAKAQIGTAGGQADSIALSPTLIGTLEAARDDLGRRLYDDVETSFCGLATVRSVAATQAVVYDSTRLWIVINRDFSVEMTPFVSEAWNRFAQSLRVVGRFALAAPMPAKSVRRLAVTDDGSTRQAAEPVAAKRSTSKA
jgi:Phage capsid family